MAGFDGGRNTNIYAYNFCILVAWFLAKATKSFVGKVEVSRYKPCRK